MLLTHIPFGEWFAWYSVCGHLFSAWFFIKNKKWSKLSEQLSFRFLSGCMHSLQTFAGSNETALIAFVAAGTCCSDKEIPDCKCHCDFQLSCYWKLNGCFSTSVFSSAIWSCIEHRILSTKNFKTTLLKKQFLKKVWDRLPFQLPLRLAQRLCIVLFSTPVSKLFSPHKLRGKYPYPRWSFTWLWLCYSCQKFRYFLRQSLMLSNGQPGLWIFWSKNTNIPVQSA